MNVKIIISVVSVMLLSMALNMDKLELSVISGLVHSFIQAAFIYGILALLGGRKVTKTIFIFWLISVALIKVTYKADVSTSIIMSVLSTNFIEIRGFVESNIVLMLVAVLISWVLLSVDLSKTSRFLVAGIMLVFCVYSLGLVIRDYSEADRSSSIRLQIIASGTPAWMVPYMHFLALQSRYFPPLGMITGMNEAAIYFLNAKESTRNGWKNSKVFYHGSNQETLILVIGESIKADLMGIFNNEEKTNPLLSAANRVKFRSIAIAAGANTWAALPSMLSYSTLSGHDASKNIINLAKEAGYRTFWLSNQGRNSVWDLSVTAIAESSDVTLFMEEKGNSNEIKPDGVLLPELEDNLRRNTGQKKLIVVHLYGSHMKFKDRYPPEFNVFGEEDDISAYRNTILYNDYVVDAILKIAARYKGKVLYVGDHGLTDADDNPPLKHDVRNNPSINSLRVPLLSTEELNLDPVINLYFFECIFAEWASIDVEEINDDHCEFLNGAKSVFFLDARMRFVRKDLEENVVGLFRR